MLMSCVDFTSLVAREREEEDEDDDDGRFYTALFSALEQTHSYIFMLFYVAYTPDGLGVHCGIYS